jgi:sugar lactone lactonase YvrE
VLDIIEQRATGRIVEFDPATGKTRVVAHGLSFPNGVALSDDQTHLYVAETGRCRLWKVAVDAADLDAGSGSPQATVLFDNLPGHPDTLMRGSDGRIWVGLSGPRSAAVDDMAGKPRLRALTLRLPRALWPLPKPYGHVFAFDEAGRVVADLQDPTGSYPETTGVTETSDRLYIQNLHLGVLGRKAR